jgi:hypothetical protein
VSWFDDFMINTQRGITAGYLAHYGYYFTESPVFGSHLDEVVDYTNFNFIDINPTNLSALSSQYFADRCYPKKWVLNV